jgi:hypothetical protein
MSAVCGEDVKNVFSEEISRKISSTISVSNDGVDSEAPKCFCWMNWGKIEFSGICRP